MPKYLYNKPDEELTKLRADLLVESHIATRKLGKDVKCLKFARRIRGNFGYRILPHKQKTWQLLTKIVDKVAPRHPTFSQGQVADALGELVNHPHIPNS